MLPKVVWNAATLDAWLKSPAQFIPGNHMTYAGVHKVQTRADLIAFLHAVSNAHHGGPKVAVPSAYTATPLDLRKLKPDEEVKAIRACRDSYFVTTGTGKVRIFWDQSLRFETDTSAYGPRPDAPAILPSGMFGDRAIVVFSSPAEISASIKQQC
ncbi:MAG: c-type cytochrome [Acetobacteraceae bacterium]